MAYCIRDTFKDILKIISLGVLASINGPSHDAFAMEEDLFSSLGRGASLKQEQMSTYQGDSIDPDDLIQLAMALSLSESPQERDFGRDFSSYAGASSHAATGYGNNLGSVSEDEQMAWRLHEELNAIEARGLKQDSHGPSPLREESGSKKHGSKEPIDPLDFLQKKWTAEEITGDEFNRYISIQIGEMYKKIKEQSIYGDLEGIEKEIESWHETAGVSGETNDMRRHVANLSSEADQLKDFLSDDLLAKWIQETALPKMIKDLNQINQGPGAFHQIQKILDEMYG